MIFQCAKWGEHGPRARANTQLMVFTFDSCNTKKKHPPINVVVYLLCAHCYPVLFGSGAKYFATVSHRLSARASSMLLIALLCNSAHFAHFEWHSKFFRSNHICARRSDTRHTEYPLELLSNTVIRLNTLHELSADDAVAPCTASALADCEV